MGYSRNPLEAGQKFNQVHRQHHNHVLRRNPLEAGQKFNWVCNRNLCAISSRNPLEAGQKFNPYPDGVLERWSRVAIPLKRGKSSTEAWSFIEGLRARRNPLEAGQKFNMSAFLNKLTPCLSQSP